MKKLVYLAVFGLLISSCSNNSSVNDYLKSNSSKNISIINLNPKKDYEMLIVESSDCPYCHKLQQDLTTNQELINSLKNIEVAPILADDTSKLYEITINNHKIEGTGQDIAYDLGVNAYPNIFFLNKSGKVVLNVPGYVKPNVMSCIANYITSKSYKTTDINAYLKQNKCIS